VSFSEAASSVFHRPAAGLQQICGPHLKPLGTLVHSIGRKRSVGAVSIFNKPYEYLSSNDGPARSQPVRLAVQDLVQARRENLVALHMCISGRNIGPFV
jgi:hypothetical protein